ncbi:MAG: hypothetical protein QOF31_913 [Mycobacterium sp.]|jgi:hypothetical protein|nr:hypothetical protein [Mycobacterium sp.]
MTAFDDSELRHRLVDYAEFCKISPTEEIHSKGLVGI